VGREGDHQRTIRTSCVRFALRQSNSARAPFHFTVTVALGLQPPALQAAGEVPPAGHLRRIAAHQKVVVFLPSFPELAGHGENLATLVIMAVRK